MSFCLTTDIIDEKYFSGELTRNLDKEDIFKYLNNQSLLKKDGIEVLKTGRNTIYKISMRCSDDVNQYIECAFKHFANDGFIKFFVSFIKSSKAKRTWDNSLYLTENGIGVPFPFFYVDMKNGEGVFVSEYLGNRISFKDKLINLLRNNPDFDIVSNLLKQVAFSIRLMHDAGFQHNDLGNQNILLKEKDNGDLSSIEFIDLNRGYIRKKVSMRQVARDLSRLTLPGELRELFDKYYFLGEKTNFLYRFLLKLYIILFSLHSRTRKYRHPIREHRIAKERVGYIGYPENFSLKRKTIEK
jgi:serine/threonine protein kinase